MEFSVEARPRPIYETVLIVVVLGLLSGFLHSPVALTAIFTGVVYAIAAVGADYYSGLSGQVTFGNFAFVAVGAYAVPVLHSKLGISAWLAALAGLICCGVLAALVGIPMARLAGLGSALVTFFLGFLVYAWLIGQTLEPIDGGASGILVPPIKLGGFSLLLNEEGDIYAGLVALLVVMIFLTLAAKGRLGMRLRLVKQSGLAALTVGIDGNRARTAAFVVSAVCAGLAGEVYGQFLGVVTPDSFTATESITLFAMVVLGGMGTLLGPILGAVFYEVVNVSFPGLGVYAQVGLAVVVLVVLIVAPRGILGLLTWLADKLGVARLVAMIGGRLTRSHRTQDRIDLGTRDAAGRPSAGYAPIRRGEDARIDNLVVRYKGVIAVQDASMKVPAGGMCALVGPNGAGKTTLLNAISRVAAVESGSIRVGRIDLLDRKASDLRRLGIARTFQHAALAPDLSVVENVAVAIPRGEARNRRLRVALSYEALRNVGFREDRLEIPVGALSLGEMKLVDIARACAGAPSLLLMDEPTAGLELEEIDNVGRAVQRVNQLTGCTVIFVAHDVGFVRKYADQVVVLNLGTVYAAGEPSEVMNRSDVGDVFLGAKND